MTLIITIKRNRNRQNRNYCKLRMNTNKLSLIIRLQLLKKNPLKRLGAGERDANEVKGEKFFEVNHFYLNITVLPK